MVDETENNLTEIQKSVFDKIAQNDNDGLKQLITQLKDSVNFVDENGMSPLQHVCCKGNKEAVNLLLMVGADINFNKHGANYTPLHFAALSGNAEICRMLLDAGINPNLTNSVFRTASQLAAFVGNHACVETIINYVPKYQLEYCTTSHGRENEQLFPPTLLDGFHKFVIDVNLHPVRIVLNLQTFGLLKYLQGVKKAMKTIRDCIMHDQKELNELKAFKFHYLGWIVAELLRCDEQYKVQRKEKAQNVNASDEDKDAQKDYVEIFIKRVLKENKQSQLEYVECIIRECAREFPFRQCTIFRHMIFKLSDPSAPALNVLREAINGQRGFISDVSYCNACGNRQPDKKCSKCKAVQYCDRECQRLHWFMHKKACNRPSAGSNTKTAPADTTTTNKEPIDTKELREELARMTAN